MITIRRVIAPGCLGASLLCVPLLCTPMLRAQDANPAVQQPTVLSAQSTVVLVPALVRDRAGRLIFTLKASDFTITDDGVAQKVRLDEDSDNQPLALVVVIETGGSGGRRLASYRDLGPTIEAVVGDVKHTAAVVTFDSNPKVAQEFTSDMNVIQDTVQGLRPGDDGAAMLDGLGLAVDILAEQPPVYRRAILLISETIDRGSRVPLQEAVRKISDTNTAIYSVAFSSTRADLKHDGPRVLNNDTPGPKGGCMSKDSPQDGDTAEPGDTVADSSQPDSADADNKTKSAPKESSKKRAGQAYDCLSLLVPPLGFAKVALMASMSAMRQNTSETVARLTGGEYFQFKDPRGLEQDLVTISNHVPNRYVLSFQPSSPHSGLHVLQLKLKDYPNLVVTARSHYWADGEEAAQPHP
ncbi:vWA domain-containing protein [Acidicapsa ligni]|uniref:VWA domain-containing protein n=1 Tax=Acidicapsa ligni TaxID=542300 RepID=UPI0021DF639E|nr:VWA domain-containing protein [Acidicapsa ligni]